MKLVLTLIVIVVFIFPMIYIAEAVQREQGDMNGDGQVNITDLSILSAQINASQK